MVVLTGQEKRVWNSRQCANTVSPSLKDSCSSYYDEIAEISRVGKVSLVYGTTKWTIASFPSTAGNCNIMSENEPSPGDPFAWRQTWDGTCGPTSHNMPTCFLPSLTARLLRLWQTLTRYPAYPGKKQSKERNYIITYIVRLGPCLSLLIRSEFYVSKFICVSSLVFSLWGLNQC